MGSGQLSTHLHLHFTFTVYALKIVNMETRLKIKHAKNAIFKVTLHI